MVSLEWNSHQKFHKESSTARRSACSQCIFDFAARMPSYAGPSASGSNCRSSVGIASSRRKFFFRQPYASAVSPSKEQRYAISRREPILGQRSLETFYSGFGGGWFWHHWGVGTGMATTTEETYTVGTLVVDLFDSRTRKLIGRGRPRTFCRRTPRKPRRSSTRTSKNSLGGFPRSDCSASLLTLYAPVAA